MEYWVKRIDSQSNVLFNHTALEIDGKLAQYYQSALEKTQIDMERLYDQLIEDGLGTRMVDLYRYNRFYQMRADLAARLTNLGLAEKGVLDAKFVDMYNGVQAILDKAPGQISTAFVRAGRAEEVLESVWCADGKHWSQRVWDNTSKLQSIIEQGLIDCVVTGRNKSEMIKTLRKEFGVGFNQADRLVRTELNYIQNRSAADRYQAAGIQEYEFLTAEDERTCEVCGKLNHKTFKFTEMAVGENCPPIHPNDRCTILPVIKG